jgi:hypothetical protein
MSKAIFIVGGGKSGVGKSSCRLPSSTSCTLTSQPFLVETDTSVPDVFKTYWEAIGGEPLNLDEREGWIELVNLVECRPECTIVASRG